MKMLYWIEHSKLYLGAKYFFSPLVPSKGEKNTLVLLSKICSVSFAQFVYFKESVFTFQFLNDRIKK